MTVLTAPLPVTLSLQPFPLPTVPLTAAPAPLPPGSADGGAPLVAVVTALDAVM